VDPVPPPTDMSSTVTDAPLLSKAQGKASRALLERVCKRLAENLQMLLGQKIRLQTHSVTTVNSSELRPHLPTDGAALRVSLESEFPPALAVLELPLARYLAHLARMGPADELKALRDAPPPLGAEDPQSLESVAGFFSVAVGQEWDGNQGDQEDAPNNVVTIAGASWDGHPDPLDEGEWLWGETSCTIENQPAEGIRILIPLELARRMMSAGAGNDTGPNTAPTDPADDQTSSRAAVPSLMEDDEPLPPVVCISTPQVSEHLVHTFPEREVKVFDNITALHTFLAAGSAPGLVIARIASGDESAIRFIAQLKQVAQGMRGCPVMLMLDDPVRNTVVLCGRLGLVNALPSTVEPDVVARRIRPALRRSPA